MREDSLSKKILLTIGDRAKDLFKLGVTIIFDPNSLMKGHSLYIDTWRFPVINSKDYEKYYKSISNLKRCGYLSENKVKNKKELYLTSKGRIEIIKNILRDKKDKKLKWDGKWRAVIFDVPEVSRKDRDFLRRELHWIGFIELQKSVWVFPWSIEKELITLSKLWKREFEGDIRFLTIEKMDDKDLRERSVFNLLA